MKVILLFQMVKRKEILLVLGKKVNLYCPCRNRGTKVTRSLGDEAMILNGLKDSWNMHKWPGQMFQVLLMLNISDVHQQQKKS